MSNNINISKNISNLNNKNNVNSNNNIKCKYCNSNLISKIGHSSYNNKQRYKCNNCHKTWTEGNDNRIKHNINERKICILNYLNGMSMRGIQRVLSILYNKKIHIQNINHWIKNADKILKEELEERKKDINIKPKTLKVLEMDELYTYIKKNPKIIMEKNIVIKEYGLLLLSIKVN